MGKKHGEEVAQAFRAMMIKYTKDEEEKAVREDAIKAFIDATGVTRKQAEFYYDYQGAL